MLSCQHFVTNPLRFAVLTEDTVRDHWPGFWTLEEAIYCYCWWCWKVSQLVEQVEWSALYGSQRSCDYYNGGLAAIITAVGNHQSTGSK